MKNEKVFYIFSISFILSLIYWRLRVFWFYNNGRLPNLRALTGLKIHHYHYGLLLLTIAIILLLFLRKNNLSVLLAGFGLGSVLDSLISGMFKSTTRAQEIANYQNNLPYTIILFIMIIFISFIFYIIGRENDRKRIRRLKKIK